MTDKAIQSILCGLQRNPLCIIEISKLFIFNCETEIKLELATMIYAWYTFLEFGFFRNDQKNNNFNYLIFLNYFEKLFD